MVQFDHNVEEMEAGNGGARSPTQERRGTTGTTEDDSRASSAMSSVISELDMESARDPRMMYAKEGNGVSVKQMETADDNGMIAEQVVEIRPPESSTPGMRSNRCLHFLRRVCCLKKGYGKQKDNVNKVDVESGGIDNTRLQYTLTSRKKASGQSSWFTDLCTSLGVYCQYDEQQTTNVGFLGISFLNFNGPTLSYLNWCFRAGFLPVFFTMLVLFMAYILMFAGFLHVSSHYQPECTTKGEKLQFLDSFSLSWTTFSTVVSC
jgi:hypothetical protein